MIHRNVICNILDTTCSHVKFLACTLLTHRHGYTEDQTEEVFGICVASWFFGENSVRKSTAREVGQKETKKMLLSQLLETSDKDMDYSQLKKPAQEQARWCRWPTKTCPQGRIQQQYSVEVLALKNLLTKLRTQTIKKETISSNSRA